MERSGFYRVGVASPRVSVANTRANGDAILELAEQAGRAGCDVLVFPELSLTGYSCADLFQQQTLLEAAERELIRVARESADRFAGLLVVGLPLRVADRLYNVAAAIQSGRLLGLVPKSHIPNYKEFYERRWFAEARGEEPAHCRIGDVEVPFGTDLLFRSADARELVVGIEICEDLWTPIPPSCKQALGGATLLLNLSASNESTGKAEYRRDLVVNQSARCVAAYVYSAAGVTESTTDVVFGGHGMIAENGQLLAQAKRFVRQSVLTTADVDLERVLADRLRMTTFAGRSSSNEEFRKIEFTIGPRRESGKLQRHVPAHPFVPGDPHRLAERCEEIFQTQMAGLAKRLEIARPPTVHLGISGGLDSTLALLVATKTADLLGLERSRVHGLTMPGFGTSERTRTNAERLMELTGISSDYADIRQLCMDIFQTLGHRPFGIDLEGKTVDEFQEALTHVEHDAKGDLVFENVQARARTMLLMNRGFVVGTGDLSELALGWSTYNGDHMSMYNPNASIPKTLVRFLVRWAADNEFAGEARDVLHSIADTEISPELLPIGKDAKVQSTESTIGPYELHDFFLYHVIRFGFTPRKLLHLAENARFDGNYSADDLRKWLHEFYRRFFAAQYKRSCLPDGPKVGSISLSPRGDWRMPSDAESATWLRALE